MYTNTDRGAERGHLALSRAYEHDLHSSLEDTCNSDIETPTGSFVPLDLVRQPSTYNRCTRPVRSSLCIVVVGVDNLPVPLHLYPQPPMH